MLWLASLTTTKMIKSSNSTIALAFFRENFDSLLFQDFRSYHHKCAIIIALNKQKLMFL